MRTTWTWLTSHRIQTLTCNSWNWRWNSQTLPSPLYSKIPSWCSRRTRKSPRQRASNQICLPLNRTKTPTSTSSARSRLPESRRLSNKLPRRKRPCSHHSQSLSQHPHRWEIPQRTPTRRFLTWSLTKTLRLTVTTTSGCNQPLWTPKI